MLLFVKTPETLTSLKNIDVLAQVNPYPVVIADVPIDTLPLMLSLMNTEPVGACDLK